VLWFEGTILAMHAINACYVLEVILKVVNRWRLEVSFMVQSLYLGAKYHRGWVVLRL
jgi:hypothetical protein